MRRMALLSLLALLLAGCSGGQAPGPTIEDGGDDDSRVSDPGSDGRADNRTRVWEHKVVWTPEAAPASTTMDVPHNVTDLVVRVANTGTPCGSNVGDPTDPLTPSADFVSPSGEAVRVPLFANECRAGPAGVFSGSSGHALDAQPGTWQVSFRGRGANLEQTIFVEGERVA